MSSQTLAFSQPHREPTDDKIWVFLEATIYPPSQVQSGQSQEVVTKKGLEGHRNALLRPLVLNHTNTLLQHDTTQRQIVYSNDTGTGKITL